MPFLKSFTSAHPVSKVMAVILFMQLPLIVFGFGMYQQKYMASKGPQNMREISATVQEMKPEPTRIPTSSPILSPNKPGWYRYMSTTLDYYIDYPETYSYGNGNGNEVSFEKQSNVPHRTNYYIFIEKGESIRESKEKIAELKQMDVGEEKVVMKKESSLPSEYKTYKRLSDISLGQKKAMAFVNETVWEAGKDTRLYTYIYEGQDTYVFGGLTNETDKSEDVITFAEFKEIISTLRFLD